MDITTWEWTRASGLTSFFLIFLSVFVGLLHSAPIFPKRWKGSLFFFHQFTGWIAFLIMIFHGVILLFDTYVNYQWYEVFVPFLSDEHRILTGIGTMALYGVFLILLSSDMMKKVGHSLWKKIHLFALPGYLLALFHGLLIGSDSTAGPITIMYASTLLLVLAALFLKRVSVVFMRKGRHAVKG
ncbi:ferric reductase-like transmembrane domain-containing protein [Domibacillus robiginosus]|uniref:ferric reductase-like transmembrane domain-containing protein n=1 Tax=Domibacillus robiginosus TaxID=1071054 RepID=UPI00067CC284|nr:ferric reductase-like transmembrane domain-containing protein [Domibacillus robiginosus]